MCGLGLHAELVLLDECSKIIQVHSQLGSEGLFVKVDFWYKPQKSKIVAGNRGKLGLSCLFVVESHILNLLLNPINFKLLDGFPGNCHRYQILLPFLFLSIFVLKFEKCC